jgi:hypothetical protein
MQPDIIDWDAALVLELIRPLATMLILDILPLWPYAFFEKMIVGLESKL